MLNSGQNWLFVLCDLEIWRMTLKINKIPFLFYVNLWASFQIIQIGVMVRKRSIRVRIGDFLAAWPRNLTDDLDKQYSSIPHQALCVISKPSVNSNWGYSLETSNWGRNRWFSVPCDLEIWLMTLKNNRAPLLCYFKLCASFHSFLWIQTGVTVRKHPLCKNRRFVLTVWPWDLTDDLENNRTPLPIYFKLCASFDSHWWIQTGVTVRKCPIWAKISNFLSRVTLKFGGWPLKTNRAPLVCYFKLCASFCSHMWIQTGVTVRKGPNWVLTSVTLTFDLDLLHGHHFCRW